MPTRHNNTKCLIKTKVNEKGSTERERERMEVVQTEVNDDDGNDYKKRRQLGSCNSQYNHHPHTTSI